MAKAAVFTCDICGDAEESFNLNSMPNGWGTLLDRNGGTEAHLCTACMNKLLKRNSR